MTQLQKFILAALLATSSEMFASSGEELTYGNDREAQSAFINAAANNNADLIQRIIEDTRYNVNPKMRNAIGEATRKGHTQLAALLLTYSETGQWGEEAISNSSADSVEPLLSTIDASTYSNNSSTEYSPIQGNINQEIAEEEYVRPADQVTRTQLDQDDMPIYNTFAVTLNQNFANAGYAGNVVSVMELWNQSPHPFVVENVYYHALMSGDDAITDTLLTYIANPDSVFDRVTQRNKNFLKATQGSNVAQAQSVIQTDFQGTNPPPNVIGEALANANVYHASLDMVQFLERLSDQSTQAIERAFLGVSSVPEISTSSLSASMNPHASVFGFAQNFLTNEAEVDPETQGFVNDYFLENIHDIAAMQTILNGDLGAEPSREIVQTTLENFQAVDPSSPIVTLLSNHLRRN